uniref:ABC1 kinase family protein n=1 Tax=Parerythrobacter lutipelagi TaxID=1964208 RepID=UPI0010F7D8FA|nr:AarF/ABC1/UbiB kinase family protein [Parerythrobacter lutipelagi]
MGRLGGFGRLAGGIAGGMFAEGARRIALGELPSMNQMVLTPGNAKRLAERLAHLRGAAMKLGQMISMDAGDMLPPELSAILATLRDQANFMPARQLDTVLTQEWGSDWRKRFRRFEPRPIAAASIGQVHRALTKDGRVLAIKVQYPGIAKSIDSDVDNVATFLRMSGLLPKELDIAPLLKAAKDQLHEEADYLREGEQMQQYAQLLQDQPQFVVPQLDKELTRERILAMSFEDGIAIESLESEPQDLRNTVFEHLIRLVSRELFELGLMQTDPNFANFRYRRDDGKIVLLDFGAARAVDPGVSNAYRRLLAAGLDGDKDRIREEALAAGFVAPAAIERHRERIDRMIELIATEISRDAPFDFGDRSFVPLLRDEGMAIAEDKQSWHIPPVETLFVQRKVSGTALLGARLKAVVNVRRVIEDVFDANPA